MKTELIEVSTTRKEIKIEIPPDAVKAVYDKVSKKYAKAAQVDGFRKGFAPVDVVRMRYKEDIKSDVLQELLPAKVTEAIQEHEITPLAEPHLHLEDQENVKINGSQPIKMSVHIEVMPEIPEPDYKGLEVTRRVRPVEDEELDQIIFERRQEFSSLIPVEDRKSEKGDMVIADLEGTIEGDENGQPIKADNLEILLGDELIETSFTDNLVGVAEDEEKEFTVSYPDDFTSPVLAGKTVHYKAKIKSVGKMEMPELDDEWAKSLDEGYESMNDLREKLRADLETVSEAEADNRLRSDLIAKIIENHPFEVPDALIDVQARNLLNNFGQDLAQRGVDLQKVEKEFIETAYMQMREQAERDVRGAMLLEKIAEKEKAEVSGDEIAEEIERIADYYQTTAEEVRASLTQQGGEEGIANSLRTRKAVEALRENAKVTEGEWIDETQSVAEAEKREKAEAEKPEKPKAKKKAKSDSEKKEKPKAEKKTKKAAEESKDKKPKAEKPKAEKKEVKKKDEKKESKEKSGNSSNKKEKKTKDKK